MSDKNEVLHIHPKASERVDKATNIYVSKSPRKGTKDKFMKINRGYSTCGVCGNSNTKHIHYTSGATSDGTVEVQEIQCVDCACYTEYYFSDRM